MIGYALVGTNDFDRAVAFYDRLLDVIGAKRMMEFPSITLWGTDWSQPTLGVAKPYDGQAATVGNGSMVALVVGSRDKVDAVHAKALELGGKDEGAPAIRGDDPNGFYGAYFRDLDGNKLAVFRIGPA